MKLFAELIDRLAYEPQRNAKVRLLIDYFRAAPDPGRGYALAAITGTLEFRNAKPALLRGLIAERTDPVLFDLSYDYVGDLAETIALLWPGPAGAADPPHLSEIIRTLQSGARATLAPVIAGYLDTLDANGRFALIKLITGGLRIGVSARLAKVALAELGGKEPNEIEELWHGLDPPYTELFAWLEGRAERPTAAAAGQFRPVMLATALEEPDFPLVDPGVYHAEWKWDGIRVQAVSESDARRLYSRTGDDIGHAFPDVLAALDFDAVIDGELLVHQNGLAAPFSELQKRLNRKTVSKALLAELPAFIRAYDLLFAEGEDLRALPFTERRRRLEAFHQRHGGERLELSPLVPYRDLGHLAELRRAPPDEHVYGRIEGLMLKHRDSAYVPGRPKGPWFKWKREPHLVDAVLMYAQRGHGKRSSFYSDYTFGVWRAGETGPELVPVGKAYFGFTDEELARIDRFVRENTISRFGPVREVVHTPEEGLVFEVAFEGLARSSRHKSGIAMRFPRISRLRWDKPPAEADRIETLEALLGPTLVTSG